MSLRQRHMDPQLAMGSQRLVEGCLLAGTQGEASSPHPQSHSRAPLLQCRSASFGSFESTGQLPPLPSISHPSIICASSSSSLAAAPLFSLSYSSSSNPHHSSLYHSSYFQPMDTSPDFPHVRPRRSGSHGYSPPLPPLGLRLLLAWHASGAFS